MEERHRVVLAVALIVCIFLLVQLGALALVQPFADAGFQQTENPSDPTNSLVYLVFILVATGVMLAAFKFELDWAVRGLLVLVSGLISWYVFAVLFPPVLQVSTGSGPVNLLPLAGAAAVSIALLAYPEWYVIDAAGVVMGAGAAGLFGISFGLLPAILLLGVLAIYDAVSVYGTEHMLALAEGAMDLKVPVVLIVPTTRSYSYLADTQPQTDGEIEETAEERNESSDESASGDQSSSSTAEGEPLERGALFVGLGDAVMPAIIVASAAYFLSGPADLLTPFDIPGVLMNLPALTGMIGTLVGLVVLMYMVLQGRAHAGLPLLNGGAILGYLIGALASGISLLTALGL